MSDFDQQHQQVTTQYNAEHITINQPGTPPARSPEHIWNVPYLRNPLFTGRDEIIGQLHKQLLAKKTAALTQAISGLGGIGKTQTALEYAYRYHSEYVAVLWVRAATKEEIIEDFTKIARLFQLPEQDAQEQQQIVDAIKRWFQTRQRWLLIFDNADNVDMVSSFLPTGSSGHILLTTRAQAMRRLAHQIELTTMPLDDAISFLLRRADLLAPDTSLEQLSSADRKTAEAIVLALGRLPLALDQVGAYLEETHESLSGYLILYQQYRKVLLARRGGHQTNHAPVATTWSLAFNQIATVNPAAINLIQLCTFLSPDAIAEEMLMEGAQHISPLLHQSAKSRLTWNQIIEDLGKYSLLQRDAHTQTLSLHRLVQAVIQDEMNEQTQQHWVERAVRVVVASFPSNEVAPFLWSQRYILDALICFEHATKLHIEQANVIRLGFEVARYLHNRGQYPESRTIYQQVLTSEEKVLGSDHPNTYKTRKNLDALQHAMKQQKDASDPQIEH